MFSACSVVEGIFFCDLSISFASAPSPPPTPGALHFYYAHTLLGLPLAGRAFHPSVNAAYVVNELSSTVSVYEFNVAEARGYSRGDPPLSMLRFVQSVSTIPSAFSRKLNTCGRICVDPTGR